MSQIKLICTDIDGTLNQKCHCSKNKISQKNIEAIAEFISNKDNKLILATGRDLKRTLLIANFLEKTLKNNTFIPFVISLNGGLIFDNVNKKIVFEQLYNPSILEQTYEFLKQQNKIKNIFIIDNTPLLYIHKSLFSRFVAHTLFFRYKKATLNHQKLPTNIKKIMVVLQKPTAPALKKLIEENIPNVYVACSGDYLLDIIDNNINKCFALEKVSSMLNVNMSEICSLGNEGNDLKMLENTGFSSAVDFNKSPHLIYNNNKISLHCHNDDGTAFFQTVQKLKELKHITV